MFLLFFVQADPIWFWLGAHSIALGDGLQRARRRQLQRDARPGVDAQDRGRVSGLGWGLGYIGGIVALVLVIVLDQFDWFGMSTDNGLPSASSLSARRSGRSSSHPDLPQRARTRPGPARERVSFFQSYAVLARDMARLFKESRPTFWFLIASAIYRDGLAGVFAFGAIIAAVTFSSPTTR